MRGSVFSMEIFIALAFAAAMGWLMLTYVDDRLDSTGYFSEFYAKDLSILADVTISGPGEVTVLYDNLKSLPMEFAIDKQVKIRAGDDFSIEQSRSFGVPKGVTTAPYVGNPAFLAFSKREDSFLVAEATGFQSACEKVPRTRELDYFVRSEQNTEAIIGGMKEAIDLALSKAPEPPDPEGNPETADLIFEVIESEDFKIEHAGDKESEYLACIIESLLNAFTNKKIDVQSGSEGTFRIHADIDARVLGQTLGRAVVFYAR